MIRRMLVALLLVAAGLALLLAGGEALVRGAAGMALRLGLAPLAVGLTVVAFATSSPELAVSLEAALVGEGGVALGNVLGSNLANLGLVLGLSALLRPVPVRPQMVRFDLPVMVGSSVLFAALVFDGTLSRLDGGLLTAGAVVYTAITLRAARTAVDPEDASGEANRVGVAVPGTGSSAALEPEAGSAANAEPEALPERLEEAIDAAAVGEGRPLPLALLLIAAGLAALVAGGGLLVRGAVTIATLAGIGPAVIGLSIVAVGTSLPELATSLVAARRGHGDLAVGNAVGSNVMNVLLVAGVAALAAPLAFGELRPSDLGAMLAVSVAFWLGAAARPLLGRTAGALLVGSYAAYLIWRFAG